MTAYFDWRRGLLGVVVLASMLALAGCLGVPLGDPAKSKADSRLAGVWEWRDGKVNRAVIRQWDERTYVIDVLSGDFIEDGTTRPRERTVYKAWLTDVKGQTFLTLQPIETTGSLNGDAREKYFIVAKVKVEGNKMTASGIDTNFPGLKDAATSAALEQIIAQNLNDPKLFAEPIVATKWTPDQVKGLEKLQEAFKEWKQP
jgi:hypothetical protein